MEQLHDIWKALCTPYGADRKTIRRCWQEIQHAYQGKRRHYHDLRHLSHLFEQAGQYRSLIRDYDCLQFSIFYHDYIYSCLRKDNEMRSAEVAREKLERLGFPSYRASQVVSQIQATQQHLIPRASSDPDLPYFLDFDLAILGSSWESYERYAQQIRREYYLYPNRLYRRGRQKVLSHFLERPRLFYTSLYFERFEFRARENLKRELALL